MTPPVAADVCDMRPECERRFQEMEKRVERIDLEQRTQGQDLAALKAKVAMAGAAGAAFGSIATTLVTRLFGH